MTEPLFVPHGHFYSPIPSIEDAQRADSRVNRWSQTCKGIRVNSGDMVALWRQIAPYTLHMPFSDHKVDNLRYYYVNDMYSYGDAAIYYALVNYLRPKRIFEIGSGYTSALVLDIRDTLFPELSLTFIEPNADRLRSLIADEDLSSIDFKEEIVQDVPPEMFSVLEKNDILFIDSSHVAKAGSDVCYEIFEILPVLDRGVILHFHDVFWPFEYPQRWLVQENRAWNELYMLRAFLMQNSDYEILFFNNYFSANHYAEIQRFPHTPFLKNPGGGLWLRKMVGPSR